MFQHAFQSGSHVEIFDAKSSKEKEKDYDKLFKIFNPNGITKVYDKFIKGYIFELEDPLKTKMQFPRNEKQELALVQHYLVFQIFLPVGMPFSLEIVVTDTTKNKRRINFTSNVKALDKTYFHAKIPVDAIRRGVWLNLSIDLISFFDLFKGQTFRSIDSFVLGATCKLRKIFTMKSPLTEFSSDDEFANQLPDSQLVPKSVNFTGGITYGNQLLTLDVVQKHLQQGSDSYNLDDSFSKNSTGAISQALKVKGLLSGTKEHKEQKTGYNDTNSRIHGRHGDEQRKGIRTQQFPSKNTTMGFDHDKKAATLKGNEGMNNMLQVRGIPRRNNLVESHDMEREGSVNRSDDNSKMFNSPPKFYDDSVVMLDASPKPAEKANQRRTMSIDQRSKYLNSKSKRSPQQDLEEEEEKYTRPFGVKPRDYSANKKKEKSTIETKSQDKKGLNSTAQKEPKTGTFVTDSGKKADSRRIVSATAKGLSHNEQKQTNPSNNPWVQNAYGYTRPGKGNQQQASPRPTAQQQQQQAGTNANGKVDPKKKTTTTQQAGTLNKQKTSNSTQAFKKNPVSGSKEFDQGILNESSERFNTTGKFSNSRYEMTSKGDFGWIDPSKVVDEIESIEENLEYEIGSNASGMNASRGFSDYRGKREKEPEDLVGMLEKKNSFEKNNSIKISGLYTKDEENGLKMKQHGGADHGKVANIDDILDNRENSFEDSLENPFEKAAKNNKQNEGKSRNDEEKKKINALENQMNMASKLRPYSPPYSFGQDNNRAIVITKKNNEVVVMGKENNTGEVKENIDKKSEEMMEVVYDPVWNCYYHPKTNTYYEMKEE